MQASHTPTQLQFRRTRLCVRVCDCVKNTVQRFVPYLFPVGHRLMLQPGPIHPSHMCVFFKI